MNEQETVEAEAKNIQEQKASSFTLLREFIIVILGALIALAVDDYQEDREREERDQQVLQMIVNEIQANLDEISASGDYHEQMLPKIQESLRLMSEENRFEIPEGWKNAQGIEAIRAAYELALINGTLARLSPQSGLMISSLYDELAQYDLRRKQTNLATIQSSFKDGERFFVLKRVALEIEIEYKKTMQPYFEETLKIVASEIKQE